jgi:type IV pilus assembly protein PilO
MKIGPRELLFFLVLLGMPVAYWWFVHKPGAEQIALADKENAAKRQKLEQLDAVAHYVQDMGPEIQKLTEAIAIFEAKLPAEKEVDVLATRAQVTFPAG